MSSLVCLPPSLLEDALHWEGRAPDAVKCVFLCACYLSTVVLTFFCAGVNYVHQFCVGAAKGVLSPFVLQEIIMEAIQRLNPAHMHNHLRTPAFHQLVQRCQQAYMQVKCGLSSCLSKLPGNCLPCRCCLCVHAQRGMALGTESWSDLFPDASFSLPGTGIDITCLYGGCMQKRSLYCFCQGLPLLLLLHAGWGGCMPSPSKCYVCLLTSELSLLLFSSPCPPCP